MTGQHNFQLIYGIVKNKWFLTFHISIEECFGQLEMIGSIKNCVGQVTNCWVSRKCLGQLEMFGPIENIWAN